MCGGLYCPPPIPPGIRGNQIWQWGLPNWNGDRNHGMELIPGIDRNGIRGNLYFLLVIIINYQIGQPWFKRCHITSFFPPPLLPPPPSSPPPSSLRPLVNAHTWAKPRGVTVTPSPTTTATTTIVNPEREHSHLRPTSTILPRHHGTRTCPGKPQPSKRAATSLTILSPSPACHVTTQHDSG
jgi:hypothetical protein